MIVGLNATSSSGYGAVLVVEVGWTQPPPVGADWACCRRGNLPCARVTGATWAGLDDDPDIWVSLAASIALVEHLIAYHGFDHLQQSV